MKEKVLFIEGRYLIALANVNKDRDSFVAETHRDIILSSMSFTKFDTYLQG